MSDPLEPFTTEDAPKLASTPWLRKIWAARANAVLRRSSDRTLAAERAKVHLKAVKRTQKHRRRIGTRR